MWLYLDFVLMDVVVCSSACRGVKGFVFLQIVCTVPRHGRELSPGCRAPAEHRALGQRGPEDPRGTGPGSDI